jgi:choloylglycine hydrolase
MMQSLALAFSCLAYLHSGMACTFVEIKTTGLDKDPVVIGHTMEFNRIHPITDWAVVQYPRGQSYLLTNGSDLGADHPYAPLKYGYLAIENKFGEIKLGEFDTKVNYTIATDGMNEKGLTVATQSLYRSHYQMWDGQKNNTGKTLVWSLRVAGWLLGSFANVSEVVKRFNASDDHASDVVVSNLDMPPEWGFHWAIADAHGQSIVLEFQEGKPRIYRNTVGVMTNDPFFPWQVENLNSYSFLRPELKEKDNAISVDASDILDFPANWLPGKNVVPFNMGHGFNLGGIPGDASPPSRFVKTFFQREVALQNSPPANLTEYLVLATGLLNSVFIPLGVTGPDPSLTSRSKPYITGDHTSYATLRIPQTGFYAYRTYSDMQWQFINVSALDFGGDKNTTKNMNVDKFGFNDITADFATASGNGRRLRGAWNV